MTDRPPRHFRPDELPADGDAPADDDDADDEHRRRARRRRVRRRATTTSYELDDERRLRRAAPRVVAGPALPHRRASSCCSSSRSSAGAAAFWVQRQIDPPGEPGEPQALVIPEGSTSDDIGKLLAAEGIISSDFVWEWYLRINGGGPFQAGTYELAENSAIADVIDVLDAGPAPIEERTLHRARGAHPQGDPRPARRPRGGPRLRSGRAPAADGQRPDPLVGPAGRPAVERGDPVPRDVPHRGRGRRGGRAPQAGRPARDRDDRARTWRRRRSASTSRPTRC